MAPIPAGAGMTTVFNIYFFKHRHTGAGRYPLFHVFITYWIAAAAPRDDKGVSGSSTRSGQNAMDPRLRGDDNFFIPISIKHHHTGVVFYFYGPYSRRRGDDDGG